MERGEGNREEGRGEWGEEGRGEEKGKGRRVEKRKGKEERRGGERRAITQQGFSSLVIR